MRRNNVLKIVLIFGVLLGALCAFFLWASGGIQTPGTVEGQVYDFGGGQPPQAPPADKIIVITWNLSYAYGPGSSGEGYVPHSDKEMSARLERIGKVIRNSGADIALLQEVDFNSHRSHHIDQVRELSRITGLRYAVRVVSWKAKYIPFPFWPPKYHFGAMYSGGAVLSRYPIVFNRGILYPKPRKYRWLKNMFYLFRYSQKVQIGIDGRNVWVINNHLESYDKNERAQQAQVLAGIVRSLSDTKSLMIIGGDMNTIPLNAAVSYGYPDDKGENFRGDKTIEVLRSIAGFKEVVKDEEYRNNEASFFTFPANAPNRRLDYLFVPDETTILDARVLSVGDLSDHLPVKAELKWSKN